MDVFEAITQRRSIRQFDPQHRLSEEELERLLEAGRLAPTAFNIQHPRFVVVRDPDLRREIQALSWDQAQVTEASVLIVVCADRMAWAKSPERYWRNAPADVRDLMTGAIQQYYTGNEQAQRDECMRSCGLAAQNIMLTAQAMGYASCPMDGFDFDKVGEVIGLPDDHLISMFVVVGKPLSGPKPRSGTIEAAEQVIHDRFTT